MMIVPGHEAPIESYLSYRNRFKQKYIDKAKRLFDGIDSLSLKNNDKLKLKKQIIEKLIKEL